MVELRLIPLRDRSVVLDNYYCLHYSDGTKILHPFELITDTSLCLAMIDGNDLKAKRLLLREQDRQSVKITPQETGETITFDKPGKSAIMIFNTNNCDKALVREVVKKYLSKEADRCDHIHVATISEVNNAGWEAYWVPLQLEGKVLHARLVAKRTVLTGEDPTETDIESLKAAFNKIC